MFNCGPPMPVDDHNYWSSGIAQRQLPQCRACYNAARAMRQLAAKTSEKEALAKLKKEGPEIFHSVVRKLRYIPGGDMSLAVRSSKLYQCVSAITTSTSVSEDHGVKWLEATEWNS